jgi:hypothetical protein
VSVFRADLNRIFHPTVTMYTNQTQVIKPFLLKRQRSYTILY